MPLDCHRHSSHIAPPWPPIKPLNGFPVKARPVGVSTGLLCLVDRRLRMLAGSSPLRARQYNARGPRRVDTMQNRRGPRTPAALVGRSVLEIGQEECSARLHNGTDVGPADGRARRVRAKDRLTETQLGRVVAGFQPLRERPVGSNGELNNEPCSPCPTISFIKTRRRIASKIQV